MMRLRPSLVASACLLSCLPDVDTPAQESTGRPPCAGFFDLDSETEDGPECAQGAVLDFESHDVDATCMEPLIWEGVCVGGEDCREVETVWEACIDGHPYASTLVRSDLAVSWREYVIDPQGQVTTSLVASGGGGLAAYGHEEVIGVLGDGCLMSYSTSGVPNSCSEFGNTGDCGSVALLPDGRGIVRNSANFFANSGSAGVPTCQSVSLQVQDVFGNTAGWPIGAHQGASWTWSQYQFATPTDDGIVIVDREDLSQEYLGSGRTVVLAYAAARSVVASQSELVFQTRGEPPTSAPWDGASNVAISPDGSWVVADRRVGAGTEADIEMAWWRDGASSGQLVTIPAVFGEPSYEITVMNDSMVARLKGPSLELYAPELGLVWTGDNGGAATLTGASIAAGLEPGHFFYLEEGRVARVSYELAAP